MTKTGQDKSSIMAYHKNFVAECPTGEMTKSQFVKLTKVGHHQSIILRLKDQDKTALGEEAVFLAESIFRVFDNDCSGTMDFQEYVLALHSTRSVFN